MTHAGCQRQPEIRATFSGGNTFKLAWSRRKILRGRGRDPLGRLAGEANLSPLFMLRGDAFLFLLHHADFL